MEPPGQIERLQQVFNIPGKPARAKTCHAILGITGEGAEIMKDYKGMSALDAGLLAAAQAVEHYEMSRCGVLRIWAGELGMQDAIAVLEGHRCGADDFGEICGQCRSRAGSLTIILVTQRRDIVVYRRPLHECPAASVERSPTGLIDCLLQC
jgi:hypothetical protein